MAFKINVSHKGRTFKLETENESLIRMKIGDKLNGDLLSGDFDGYELEITGTSDIAGFPGIKGEVGNHLRKLLLTKNDKGMNTTRPGGLRLKKTVRGEEIGERTVQINIKILKEGKKKFDDICPPKPAKVKEEKKVEAAPVTPAAA
jgi:ribosomal protein S6E (S10)